MHINMQWCCCRVIVNNACLKKKICSSQIPGNKKDLFVCLFVCLLKAFYSPVNRTGSPQGLNNKNGEAAVMEMANYDEDLYENPFFLTIHKQFTALFNKAIAEKALVRLDIFYTT